MLIKAICRAATPKIVSEIKVETQPDDPKPRLSTCGIGAIKSTLSGVTKASTDAVPRMNISAMIGAEIQTERLSTCGIGAIKSTLSGVTKASTDAVPRMNI